MSKANPFQITRYTSDMNKLLFLLITIVLCSGNSFAQEKKKKEEIDPKNKIKKYLQIEDINVPKTLEEIDFEIRQNTIDVVLNSPKYIFLTSKRDKVVNKNYREYNSLKVTLSKTTSKTYVANIHLENWYSAKYDRKFKVILSKYNLLTDLRMGIYELLYGKVFVRKNREKLIQYSAIRIKRIKELALSKNKASGGGTGSKSGGKGKNTPDDELIKEKKEQKPKKKAGSVGGDSSSNQSGKKGKQSEEKNKEEENEETAAKRKDDEKKQKEGEGGAGNVPNRGKTKVTKLENEEEQDIDQVLVPEEPPKDEPADIRIGAAQNNKELDRADDEPSALEFFKNTDLFDSPPRIFINKKSLFSAKLMYTSYSVASENYLLATSLDMTFLRFGANINIVEERVNPFSYNFILLAGTSVQNEVAQIPAWRTLEANAAKYFFSNFLKLGIGVESSPYFHINVPIAGEGQQLYEQDILWIKGIAEIKFNLFRREFTLGGSYSQSLFVSSSVENYKVTALKSTYFARYFVTPKNGAEFSSSGYNFSGTDQGEATSSTGTNYSLNFITKFQ